jgi:uncharacterized phage protein (TIGR01671 family)
MREILFRGKSNYENVGEWEYGLVAQPHVTEDGIVTSYYFTKLCEDGHSSQRTVSANTIGQYTGLTDKNGKKIFEGDVIEYEHELSGYLRFELGEDYKPRRSHSCHWDDKHYLHYKRNYAVEWKEKDARWILRNGSDQHDLRRISLSMHNGVVIGNIHDNPELLKEGAE